MKLDIRPYKNKNISKVLLKSCIVKWTHNDIITRGNSLCYFPAISNIVFEYMFTTSIVCQVRTLGTMLQANFVR